MLFTAEFLKEIVVHYTSEIYWEQAGVVRATEHVALLLFKAKECCNPDRHDSEIIRWALIRLEEDGQWPYGEELYATKS
jgi:hypothetical protein